MCAWMCVCFFWGGARRQDIKVTPPCFKRSPVKSMQLCMSVINTQQDCTHQAESSPLAAVDSSSFFALLYHICFI